MSRNRGCVRLLQRALTRCEGSLSSSHPGFEPRGAGHQISSVEKLVGYPTPLLSLRHLVGSDFNHLSEQIRRLLSSKHPVVKHARYKLGVAMLLVEVAYGSSTA